MHAGRWYFIGNIAAEAMLVLDMLVRSVRAFYNAKGVLISDLRAIRTRYLSSSFALDLVSALPLQAVVALNGSVNQSYIAWLRLPKMLRIYRYLQLYRQHQMQADRVGILVGTLRLFLLLFCLTHLFACAPCPFAPASCLATRANLGGAPAMP